MQLSIVYCPLLIVAFVHIALAAFPQPTALYTNHKTLISPDVYDLYWNVTDDRIEFELQVKNAFGWVAFGISPTGGMEHSDVIVTWIGDNGQDVQFTDRFIYDKENINVDKQQDWFATSVFRQDEYMIVKFYRKLVTCDPRDEDIDIGEGMVNIIFSYGTEFKKTATGSKDITYHGASNRGSKAIMLTDNLKEIVQVENDVEKMAYRVNVTIHPVVTDYHCEVFKLPEDWTNNKRHLIQYETLHTVGNEKNFHHVLMYECKTSFETEYLASGKTIPAPGPCYPIEPEFVASAALFRPVKEHCSKISLGWAVGGDYVMNIPSGLGYPLGGSETEFKYFMLEIHYTNFAKVEGIKDYSGIEFTVTKNYRPTEVGIATVGGRVNSMALLIPPGAEKFETDFYCTKDCVNHLVKPTKKITVYGTLAHTHLAGVEIYTSVVRDKKEIAMITNNKHYDSEYQHQKYLAEPIVINEDDEIFTRCVYSTPDRTHYTVGGLSTYEEMCLDFLWYHPRTSDFASCQMENKYAEYRDFLTGLNRTGEIKLASDLSINGIDYAMTSLNNKGATKELIQAFQDYNRNGKKEVYCASGQDMKVYDNTDLAFVRLEEPKCNRNSGTTLTFSIYMLLVGYVLVLVF